MFFICAIYDVICYASLNTVDWAFVALLCVFSLWQFIDYYRLYIRGKTNAL